MTDKQKKQKEYQNSFDKEVWLNKGGVNRQPSGPRPDPPKKPVKRQDNSTNQNNNAA